MTEINNVLIIGITGNGKSALANLLADIDEFKENSSSTSATKDFQKSEKFEWKGKRYRVIDNIGFGDTNNISEEEILLKIGEGIHSAQEGLNQVLFVFKGRFSLEQVETFNRFKKFISESKITKFTTLVRTNFPSFRDKETCEENKEDLLSEENKDLRETIKSCNGFLHIDNPPIPEVDEEDSDNEEEINISNEKREASRKIVLDYLAEKCQDVYRLEKWDSIYFLVINYIKKKGEIEKSDSLIKKEELKKLRSEVVKEIKANLEAELTMFSKLNVAIESSIQKIRNFPYKSATRTKRSLSFSSQTETYREEEEFMEIDSPEQFFQTEAAPKK